MNTFRKHPLRIYTILLLIITLIVSSTTIFLVTQTKYNKFNKPTNNKSAIITHTPSIYHTPIPHTSYTPIRQARTALNSQQGCGVTKISNGGYNFSWLHVDNATGYIMDAQNCIVDLRGFEWAGIEFGDATSGGLNEQRLAWFNQTFNMNYIRLPLNVTWWNNDVFVPNAGLHYRAWIQQVIKWAENNGDYILLNRVSQYSTPPCGGAITFCPSQAEPDKNNPPLPTSPQNIQTSTASQK